VTFSHTLSALSLAASITLTSCMPAVDPGVDAAGEMTQSVTQHTRGTITETPSRLQGFDFLLEERPDLPRGPGVDPTTAGGKFHVSVTPETEILRRTAAGGTRRAAREEFATGMQVEVWFVGPIRESYPAQGTAGHVLILDPAP
jgi:hypothetical protein